MTASRPVASLRPTLLARKGGAEPAMRSGLPHDIDSLAQCQEALGRNDLCEDTVPLRVKPASSSAPGDRRTAFTLRLDTQRHFKLRLASTLRDCSAQSLVTEALDQFLDSIPQLDALAAKLAVRPNTAEGSK